MHTENNFSDAGPGKLSGIKKKFGLILIIVSAVILLLFFLIPVYLSSEAGKNFIVKKINSDLDGKVKMNDFSMGWFKGVRITDLSFEDSTGSTSVNIRELRTKPSYFGLLFGNVELSETQIAQPEMRIGFKQDEKSLSLYVTANEISSKELKSDKKGLSRISLTIKGGNAIMSPAGRKQKPLLEFKNIAAKVDLKPAGENSSFDVSMDVAGGGRASKITAKGNLKPPKKKGWSLKGTSGDFTVKIDGLDLESLQPLFSLMGKEIDASGKLDADIVAKIDDGRFEKLKAKAVLSGFKKKIDGKAAVLDEPIRIDAQISSDRDDIKIDRLSIKSSFCTLSCSGGTNSVDYEVTADLAGLQGFAGQFTDFKDYKFAGSAVKKGTMSFGKGWIKTNGLASIENFTASVNGKSVRSVLPIEMPFDVELDTEKDILKIILIRASGDFGNIALTNSTIPLTEDHKNKLAVKVSADLDLEKTQPFLELFSALPEGIILAGQLVTDVSIARKRNNYHIVTDRTKVADLKVGRKGQEPFEEKLLTVSVDMLCNPEEKTLAINDMQVKSSQINITKGRFTQSTKRGKTTLSGQLIAEYDLAAISKLPVMPEGLSIRGKRSDNIKFESSYPEGQSDKMMANLNTKTKFGFDSAEYKGLYFGALEVDLEVKDGLLTISPFSAKVNNGMLNFGGSADLNQDPKLFKTPGPIQVIDRVAITDKMAESLLVYLNPIFAGQVGISGVGNFHCSEFALPIGKKSTKDIVIAGTVWIDDLKLRPIGLPEAIFGNQGNFALEKTDFVLRDGLLTYDDMQLNVGDNPLNFAGKIDLENEFYTLKVTLPYTRDRKTVHVGEDVANRITYSTSGSLKNGLRFDNLMQAIAEQLIQGETQKLIEEKVEEYFGEEGKRLLREIFR